MVPPCASAIRPRSEAGPALIAPPWISGATTVPVWIGTTGRSV
jgi:hypothetical protein